MALNVTAHASKEPFNDSKLTEYDSNEDDSNDTHNNHHLREKERIQAVTITQFITQSTLQEG